jgi:hypothetical protein
MKKLFIYLIIRLTTRHAETACKIYQKIYDPESIRPIINVSQSTETPSVVTVETPKSKKQEIVDSLNYLKSKPVKTKKDKESIYSLEMVLKNM